MARRTSILALALLLQFLLPLVSPLFAFGDDDDASLPACCRRNGAHHCAMRMQMQAALPADSSPHVDAPYHGCPFLPHAMVAGAHPVQPFSPVSVAGLLPPASHPAGMAQAEARRRVAAERARHKRGPPAPFSFA